MLNLYVKLVIFSTKWIKNEEQIFRPFWSSDIIYNKMILRNKQEVQTVVNRPELEEIVVEIEKHNKFSYQLFSTKVSPIELNKSKLFNDPYMRQYVKTKKNSKWIYNTNDNSDYLCENVYNMFKN